MPKRSRSRADRRAKFAPAYQQYTITDRHTRLRVVLAFGAYFSQLVRRGLIERTGPRAGRLAARYRLASAELAPNGQPQLECLMHSDGPCIPIWSQVIERNWLYTAGPVRTFEQRQFEIERETQTWGLPEGKPLVISRQFI